MRALKGIARSLKHSISSLGEFKSTISDLESSEPAGLRYPLAGLDSQFGPGLGSCNSYLEVPSQSTQVPAVPAYFSLFVLFAGSNEKVFWDFCESQNTFSLALEHVGRTKLIV
jgi:hypothetical protein